MLAVPERGQRSPVEAAGNPAAVAVAVAVAVAAMVKGTVGT